MFFKCDAFYFQENWLKFTECEIEIYKKDSLFRSQPEVDFSHELKSMVNLANDSLTPLRVDSYPCVFERLVHLVTERAGYQVEKSFDT